MLRIKNKLTCLLLFTASVMAVDACISINEDYSLKNIEGTASLLPGVSSKRDVSYEIPLKDFLTYYNDSDYVRPDANGDFRIHASGYDSQAEVLSCSITDQNFSHGADRTNLSDLRLVYSLQYPTLTPLYDRGVAMHFPIEVEVENPDGLEGELSIEVQPGGGGDPLKFGGLVLKPGQNKYVLDTEELAILISDNLSRLQYLRFTYSRKGHELPKPVCRLSASASLPVEIMPGQKFSFHYDSYLFYNLELNDDFPGLRNKYVLFTTGLSFESTIPADISFKSAVDEYGWFVGGIEGFDTIHAGTMSSPGVTEMTWTVESQEGLNCYVPFEVEVSVMSAEKPFRLNSGQKLSVRSDYVKFENGI